MNMRYDDNCERITNDDGSLIANNDYKLNEIRYSTDDKGRIESYSGVIKHNAAESPRIGKEQIEVGKIDGRPTDDAGHLIGLDNGGADCRGNCVLMDGTTNKSDFKAGDNQVKKWRQAGDDVSVSGKITYSDNSMRPAMFERTIDNGKTEMTLLADNNRGSTDLLGKLDSLVTKEVSSAVSDAVAKCKADFGVGDIRVTNITVTKDVVSGKDTVTMNVIKESTNCSPLVTLVKDGKIHSDVDKMLPRLNELLKDLG